MSRHAPRKSLQNATSIMAPSSAAGKRVKGKQVYRPFIYGTTARPFDPVKNPKPAGVPDDHTHAWTVFVKGVDDTDITYWLKRVQFKLHDSIPNHLRTIDADPGKPFQTGATGWGEFDITIKLYYVAESGEKPQTIYHRLLLHAYGPEAEKAAMVANGEVPNWSYEEQLFNEPYELFYDILTSGAVPSSDPNHPDPAVVGSSAGTNSKSKGRNNSTAGKGKGGVKEVKERRSEGGVLERSAMVPRTTRPGHPFSLEAQELETKKLRDAMAQVDKMREEVEREARQKLAYLEQLKKEAAEEARARVEAAAS